MALFTTTSVAVDVLPSRFHTILIVSGKMQFVFFVGVVVRGKCIGHRRTSHVSLALWNPVHALRRLLCLRSCAREDDRDVSV